MNTAHNSSTHRYLIPSGSVHILKSKKELYSGGKNSHEYLMTSTESKAVPSHFESDISRRAGQTFHSRPRFMKDVQNRDSSKTNVCFNDSLIKQKTAVQREQLWVPGTGDMSRTIQWERTQHKPCVKKSPPVCFSNQRRSTFQCALTRKHWRSSQ